MSAVILDLEMPERNGIETAQWIREFEKRRGGKKQPVAILGLTGHEDSEIKAQCISAGMNVVLSKPIQKCDVLAALKELAGV